MLVDSRIFYGHAAVISELKSGHIGFDFETDGLYARKGARAFIMGYTDNEGKKFCVRDMDRDTMRLFFSNPHIYYCPHRENFERSFLLHQFGVRLIKCWDTETMARVENNSHKSYSLQNCAKRIGLSKHQPMLDWLAKKGNKNMYHLAPADIVEPYVEQDAWLSWEIRRRQLELFRHWDTSSPVPIKNVVRLELKTAPHLFDMEDKGLLVDVHYCERAAFYEKKKADEATAQFEKNAGVGFVDSARCLVPVFDRLSIPYGQTEKGNPSFTEEVLSPALHKAEVTDKAHGVISSILSYRSAKKRLSSYWENFLELEHNGLIHPSINTNRAQTGRMSISEPSCQNWSTDEDGGSEFPIRRVFIARPGCFIASLDYSQMEARKASDEAEDFPMIEKINSGADLHSEVAAMAGVPRSLAKNGKFCRQYGGGEERMALTLGVSIETARRICEALDKQAEGTTDYSRSLTRFAKRNPFGYDWLGRRFYFDRGFEYKYFNYRIQGGCAEILKIAICEIGEFLKKNARPETFMLIPIHDEIVLNMHEEDQHLLPEIKRLMIAAHRDKKHLGMEVNVAIGPNFYDLEEITV